MQKVFLTIIVTFLMISNLVGVDFSNRDMIIRMNGHDHYVHDFISDTLNKAYEELSGEIRQDIIDELNSIEGMSINNVGQPSISEITFRQLTTGTGQVKVKIPNWNLDFTFYGCPYDRSFDLTLSAKIKTEVDTSYWMVLYDIEPKAVIHIGWDLEWYQIWKKIICSGQIVTLLLIQDFIFIEPFEYAINDIRHEIFSLKDLPGNLVGTPLFQEACCLNIASHVSS